MINSRNLMLYNISAINPSCVRYVVRNTNPSSAFQIYELSYFLNVASAITFLGALLPVHNSNWT